MLAHLRVENLALIGSAEFDLDPGLNVLSGETGAGKSVLVEALALLTGGRVDTAVVRTGAEAAIVEGLFRLERAGLRRHVGETLGDEVEELSLRREIFRDQRNRCYAAGRLAPAALLRELGESLIELHGQHEHQRVLRPAVQRDLLDAFGGLEEERIMLEHNVGDWRAAARRLEAIRERQRARSDRLRALREEVDEIARAEIHMEREAELRAEAARLRNLEDRLAAASRAAQALIGSESGNLEPGALDLLRTARPDILALARDEPRLASAGEHLTSALDDLHDLARELQRYMDGLVRDPVRLAELDAREALLVRLSRRYTTDLEGLLEREARGRAEIEALEGEVAEEADLERQVAETERHLWQIAHGLSKGRRHAADALAAAVRGNLRDLGLGKGDFAVRFASREELEPGGLERVDFMIAPNPGEPPAPLRAIASGGEISRVVLAVKAALAGVDQVPTLIFDEIDVGIGGRVAQRVAAKLAEIAERRQVIVVTHLAQIAAQATLHLRVEKVVRERRALTTVAPLGPAGRLEELSRMLGGQPGNEGARRYARELLGNARGSR